MDITLIIKLASLFGMAWKAPGIAMSLTRGVPLYRSESIIFGASVVAFTWSMGCLS